VLTVPSKFEKETFDLYCRYQQEIHHDDIEELTEKKYKRFLVDSPLEVNFLFTCLFNLPHQCHNNYGKATKNI